MPRHFRHGHFLLGLLGKAIGLGGKPLVSMKLEIDCTSPPTATVTFRLGADETVALERALEQAGVDHAGHITLET